MELIVEKINKSFGEKHVLRDVGFTVRGGSAFGLIGRNGSGKTTTIRIIMGLFPADSGTVTADGAPSGKVSSRFGYLPE
ncbi:MAG: ATP-binding cassette domain-containing protein, partial [Oscillospiraceae bacterium]|nr:ATP-binding cassette domain-containing protein [Oscillospiraceae bacterium]